MLRGFSPNDGSAMRFGSVNSPRTKYGVSIAHGSLLIHVTVATSECEGRREQNSNSGEQEEKTSAKLDRSLEAPPISNGNNGRNQSVIRTDTFLNLPVIIFLLPVFFIEYPIQIII